MSFYLDMDDSSLFLSNSKSNLDKVKVNQKNLLHQIFWLSFILNY